MERKCGIYLGTEIDEKWWKRFLKDGFFIRGNGEYWYDDKAFYFLRHLTKNPIVIPFDRLDQLKTGSWHCGRWVFGKLILKFLWRHQGLSLSSGFVLSLEKAEVERYVNEINLLVQHHKNEHDG